MIKNKGQFQKGHPGYWKGKKRGTSGMAGKTHPLSWRRKMRKIMKGRKITWGDKISKAKKGIPSINQRQEKSPSWLGDKIGKAGVHLWVKKHKGTPRKCEDCGSEEKKVYDWANKDHSYKRILEDYIRLCRSCHRKYDIKFNGYKIKGKYV